MFSPKNSCCLFFFHFFSLTFFYLFEIASVDWMARIMTLEVVNLDYNIIYLFHYPEEKFRISIEIKSLEWQSLFWSQRKSFLKY